jgi:hypothetical protein
MLGRVASIMTKLNDLTAYCEDNNSQIHFYVERVSPQEGCVESCEISVEAFVAEQMDIILRHFDEQPNLKLHKRFYHGLGVYYIQTFIDSNGWKTIFHLEYHPKSH